MNPRKEQTPTGLSGTPAWNHWVIFDNPPSTLLNIPVIVFNLSNIVFAPPFPPAAPASNTHPPRPTAAWRLKTALHVSSTYFLIIWCIKRWSQVPESTSAGNTVGIYVTRSHSCFLSFHPRNLCKWQKYIQFVKLNGTDRFLLEKCLKRRQEKKHPHTEEEEEEEDGGEDHNAALTQRLCESVNKWWPGDVGCFTLPRSFLCLNLFSYTVYMSESQWKCIYWRSSVEISTWTAPQSITGSDTETTTSRSHQHSHLWSSVNRVNLTHQVCDQLIIYGLWTHDLLTVRQEC